VVAQFVALALTWGSSFLLIKVALVGVSPGQVVLARLCLGALALAAVSLAMGAKVPARPGPWLHLSVVATFLCVLPFLGFAWAEQEISSGLASI
jgi:drug/metabolite transporter (DMT)-like permease